MAKQTNRRKRSVFNETHLQLSLYVKDIEGKPENVPFATSFPLYAGLHLCCIGQNQNLWGGRPNINSDRLFIKWRK